MIFFSSNYHLRNLIRYTHGCVGAFDRGHVPGCSESDLRVTSSDMSRGHVTQIVSSRDNKMGGDVIWRREQEQTHQSSSL